MKAGIFKVSSHRTIDGRKIKAKWSTLAIYENGDFQITMKHRYLGWHWMINHPFVHAKHKKAKFKYRGPYKKWVHWRMRDLSLDRLCHIILGRKEARK
jgi:hypothetical protein